MTDISVRDERDIVQLINRYGLAMDTLRWDLFDSIFTDDVELDYSGVIWKTLAVVKADFAAAHAGFDATRHAMSNHLVDIDGDRATAFTYCDWRMVRGGLEHGDFLAGDAWFDDALIRTEAGWRIARRTCRIAWTSGNPQVIGLDQAPPAADLRGEAGGLAYLNSFSRRAISAPA